MRKKALLRQGITRGNALAHAASLLDDAMKALPDKEKARKLVRKARRISMKFRLRIPPQIKRRFCRHCNSIWQHGKNVRVRMRNKMLVYYCLECRKYSRYGTKK